MSRLEWDKTSERLYETGVKQCALYAWEKDAAYAVTELDVTAPSDFGNTYYVVSEGTYSSVGSAAFDPEKEYYKFTDLDAVPQQDQTNWATAYNKYYKKTDSTYAAAASADDPTSGTYATREVIASKLPSDWTTTTYVESGSSYVNATSPYNSSTTYYKKVDGYGVGVAWNGITAINETPTGAEATDLYADDMKYLSLLSAEELEGTIEAYMYPDEWEQCDGSVSKDGITFGQQSRKQFCLAYITTVGNDTDGNDFGEKLHLLYNGKASPSERAYATINDSPEAITFSWSLKATKEKISDAMKEAMKAKGIDLKDTALITINKVDKNGDPTPYYDTIYKAVYGDTGSEPRMLMPDDICAIITGTNTNG